MDTEEGLIAVLEYCKLVPSYKERIAVQVRKQEEAAKNLGFNVKTREKPSSTLNTDEEIE